MKTTIIIKLDAGQIHFLRKSLNARANTKPEALVKAVVLKVVADAARKELDADWTNGADADYRNDAARG